MSTPVTGVPAWYGGRTRNSVLSCQKCGSKQVAVIDTRSTGHGIRRRRVCLSCGVRFSTIELPMRAEWMEAVLVDERLLEDITSLHRRLGQLLERAMNPEGEMEDA